MLRSFHFSSGASLSGAAAGAAVCTPCAAIRIRDQQMASVRQVECEPCEDAKGRSVGSSRALPTGGTNCLGKGTCECPGGPPSTGAPACPSMGFYLLTPQMDQPSTMKELLKLQAQSNDQQHDAGSFAAVANTVSSGWGLFECKPVRDRQLGSTCRHWTDCRTGETEVGNPTASQLPADAQSCDQANPNCCLQGYTGFLCEECQEGFARIGGNCIPCTEPRRWKVGLGVLFAGAFVIVLMYSSVKTLGNATAMFTIVTFFFQVVTLLMRGRYSSLAFFSSVINLQPLDARQSDACNVVGGTYFQWYYLVFGFPGMMAAIFCIVMAIAWLTTEKGGVINEVKITLERAGYTQICESVLQKSELFSLLTEQERHLLALKMTPTVIKRGDELVRQGHITRSMYVLLDGKCVLKHTEYRSEAPEDSTGSQQAQARSRQDMIRSLDQELKSMTPTVAEPGAVFGEQQQLKGGPAPVTVVAWPHHVIVAALEEDLFDSLGHEFSDNSNFVGEFIRLRAQRQLAGYEPDHKNDVTRDEKHSADSAAQIVSSVDIEECNEDSTAPQIKMELEGQRLAEATLVLAYNSSHRHVRESGWGKKQGRSRFERFDKDDAGRHTGHLNEQQLRAMLVDMGIECTDEYVSMLLKRVDKNGDGTVDFDEFQKLWNILNPPRGVKYGLPGTGAEGLLIEEAATRKIINRCGCAALARKLSNKEDIALANLYTACFEKDASRSTFLEMCLALYCPTLLELPQIVLCNQETMTLEYDMSLPCYSWQHKIARAVASLTFLCLVLGLPMVMFLASRKAALTLEDIQHEEADATLDQASDEASETKHGKKTRGKKRKSHATLQADWRRQRTIEIHEKALKIAKAKFVLHWDTMDPESQSREIEKCVTMLRNEEFGSEVWFLANLQMSTKPTHAGWFPIWFVMSRSTLNLFFLMDNFQYVSLSFDWRVPALFLLAVSAAIHNRVQPFRYPADNSLLTVGLSLLILVFTMDLADQTEDGLVSSAFCGICSLYFATVLAIQSSKRKRILARSRKSWNWTRSNWESVLRVENVKKDYAARHIQHMYRRRQKKASRRDAMHRGNDSVPKDEASGSMHDKASVAIAEMRAEQDACMASTDNPVFDSSETGSV